MSDKRRVTPVTPHTGTNFNSYVFTNAQISTMQSNDEFIAEMVRRMEEDKGKKVINMQPVQKLMVMVNLLSISRLIGMSNIRRIFWKEWKRCRCSVWIISML